MADFRITVSANELLSSGEASAASLEEAKVEALRSTLMIGTDEICRGRSDFSAEVTVSQKGRTVDRHRIVINIEQVD